MNVSRPAEVPDQDRFLMGESEEGVAAVVTPHPAGSNTWKVWRWESEGEQS